MTAGRVVCLSTRKLIEHMRRSDDVHFIADYISADVRSKSGGRQVPWHNASLDRRPGEIVRLVLKTAVPPTFGAASTPASLGRGFGGHIHSASCNHAKAPAGDVWTAVERNDVDRLVAALGRGCSTEEATEVSTLYFITLVATLVLFECTLSRCICLV